MHDMNDELPDSLREGIPLLRDEPPVRDEWRSALLARVAATPRVRGWYVSQWAAIAAGLVCVAIGAAAAWVVLEDRRPVPVATSTALPPVRFDLIAPTATRVTIVGDFNGWNPEALPMTRSADGRTWQVEVRLAPGRYTYGFIVDGRLVRDPAAPESASDDFGVPSSVLMVSRTGTGG